MPGRKVEMPTVPGDRWRVSHQAAVDAFLFPSRIKRPVVSRGARFYNQDHWPALRLVGTMTKWMRAHPEQIPSRKVVEGWCSFANKKDADLQSRIVIARTPDRLPWKMALALNGGAAHEAWHTLFSKRTRLMNKDVHALVQEHWKLAKNWGPLANLLQEFIGIAEDVRIERRGVERWPATLESMEALQDFILGQEETSRLQEIVSGADEESLFSPLTVALGSFRDLGFAYSTEACHEIMDRRRRFAPEAVDLVAKGALRPILEECAQLGAKDGLGFLRVSMKACAVLAELQQEQPEPEQQQGFEMGEGESGDASATASQIIEASSQNASSGLQDLSQALANAITSKIRETLDLQSGEKPWMPHSTEKDSIAPAVSRNGAEEDRDQAQKALDRIPSAVNYLRSRFRSMMRAQEMTRKEHGVRFGNQLSERNLVNTVLDIRQGTPPTRAFARRSKKIDMSLAAAISRDQSYSTIGFKHVLDQVMLLLTEPIENVGGQVFAFGWRYVHGGASPEGRDPNRHLYHRLEGVQFDVFKNFGERLANVKGRFVNSRAAGGTPIVDGIEFGLRSLSERPEAHRILFVITDGKICDEDKPILRNQLRRAKEAGIVLIGVGCGSEAKDVIKAFPEGQSVWEKDPEDLAAPLVALLKTLLDKRARNRGKKVRKQ